MEETIAEKKSEEKKIEKPVAVRFKPCGRMYVFDACDLEVTAGECVVVESMFGLTIGKIVRELSPEDVNLEGKEIKKVIRIATEEDFKKAEDNKSLQDEAYKFCLERIEARGLPMKLVGTEATLDRRRIIFYFTADGRIDFRELVKDLAAKFKTRIEMRQIGVRDEAKLLGGIGICGRVLCCNSFLSEFAPISIKMAKDQELVLNTSKLTGLCGRLMCCLSYEYDGKIEGEDEVITEDMEGCLCEECKPPEVTVVKTLEPATEEKEEGEKEVEIPPVEEVTATGDEIKGETKKKTETPPEQKQTEDRVYREDRSKKPTEKAYQRREQKRPRDTDKKRHKKKRRHSRHKKKKRGKR